MNGISRSGVCSTFSTPDSVTAISADAERCRVGTYCCCSSQYIYTNYTAIPNYITYRLVQPFPGDNAIWQYQCHDADLWTNSSGIDIFFHTVGTGSAYNGTGSNIVATALVQTQHLCSADEARGYVDDELQYFGAADDGSLTAVTDLHQR